MDAFAFNMHFHKCRAIAYFSQLVVGDRTVLPPERKIASACLGMIRE